MQQIWSNMSINLDCVETENIANESGESEPKQYSCVPLNH